MRAPGPPRRGPPETCVLLPLHTCLQAYLHLTHILADIPYEPYPSGPLPGQSADIPDNCSALPWGNLTVSNYTGRDDIVAAITGTTFYSGLIGPNCSYTFRCGVAPHRGDQPTGLWHTRMVDPRMSVG